MRHTFYHRASRLAVLLLALLAAPLAWPQESLEVRQQQGVSFVSGGFGQDERDQLQAMQSRFNLKLVFAVAAGNYLSDIDVRIMDEQGSTLVETRTDGPILMAKLSAGTYTVAADNKGSGKQRSVDVGGQGITEATFTWPAE